MAYTPPASLAGEKFYAVGAPAPWPTFVPLSYRYEGTGRIAIETWRTSAGALADLGGFVDLTMNAFCGRAPATDGKIRCLPLGTDLSLFADSACTVGIVAEPSGFPVAPGQTFATTNRPGPGVAVFRVQRKIAAPTAAWQYTGTTCLPTRVPSDDDFYATTLTAPSDFVEVVGQVE